ncbi:hypothetical protein [Arthrobacter sp. B0490]|uniref:hypothetical protein n=1 Tax=Arthrobacter sp. B0490 TaxID=2058891 RepID=UPI000CE326D6|nr:hypothetical protein [Arthrobacter sp. B0490]
MAWLFVDKHAAVWDDDANVQAAIGALKARLDQHPEVHLSIQSKGLKGPVFVITRDTVLSSPELSNRFNADLFAELTTPTARNSPTVHWFSDGRGFVSETNSRMW